MVLALGVSVLLCGAKMEEMLQLLAHCGVGPRCLTLSMSYCPLLECLGVCLTATCFLVLEFDCGGVVKGSGQGNGGPREHTEAAQRHRRGLS